MDQQASPPVRHDYAHECARLSSGQSKAAHASRGRQVVEARFFRRVGGARSTKRQTAASFPGSPACRTTFTPRAPRAPCAAARAGRRGIARIKRRIFGGSSGAICPSRFRRMICFGSRRGLEIPRRPAARRAPEVEDRPWSGRSTGTARHHSGSPKAFRSGR